MENEERASLEVVEPTVMAFAARAGDLVQALVLSLPAATANVTPLATALLTEDQLEAIRRQKEMERRKGLHEEE